LINHNKIKIWIIKIKKKKNAMNKKDLKKKIKLKGAKKQKKNKDPKGNKTQEMKSQLQRG